MALILQVDKVKYKCSCEHWEPLCRLYFCRHCSLLRCRQCLTHEIDSTYCPSCLENIPSGEARMKKNRCGNCLQCPVCCTTLTIRGSTCHTSASPADTSASEADSSSPTKVFYLQCNSCRWSSRQAGICDQNSPLAGWPSHINHNEQNLKSVVEHFKCLASVEKTDRERKKYTKRRANNLGVFSDRHGLQNIYNRRRMLVGLADKEISDMSVDAIIEADDQVPELPENIFTESVDPQQVVTLKQRISQPLAYPIQLDSFYPIHKPLVVRRSLRCKKCDHSVCKGEYNPSSIKFKIQLFGILHVPEVRLLEKPQLKNKDDWSTVKLTLTNLTAAPTRVVLLPDPDTLDDVLFVQAKFPVDELALPHRDETAELEELNEASPNQFNDNPEVVIFRKRHRLGIAVPVQSKPEAEFLAFIIKYDYVNNLASGNEKEQETSLLQQHVKISLLK